MENGLTEVVALQNERKEAKVGHRRCGDGWLESVSWEEIRIW